jgi:hypothetical protein
VGIKNWIEVLHCISQDLVISSLIVAKRLGHLLPGMQQEMADYIDGLVTPIEVELHTNCTRIPEKEKTPVEDPYM